MLPIPAAGSDGKEMTLLAESPRQSFCTLPETTSGEHTITIVENGKTAFSKVSAVNMDLSTGKLNLRKGEKTYVDVAISGLQNLPANATLSVNNASGGTVAMTGGETQVITIPPADINTAGTFQKRFDLQSLRTGSFSLNVNLDLPAPNDDTPISGHTAALCNCYINQYSYLLPLSTCLAFGGSTDPASLNNDPASQISVPTAYPPIVSFVPPGDMNPQTEQILLTVNAPANDVAAVIFSARPVSGTLWQPAGTAVNTGDSWQTNWTAPIGNDGEYIIRARIAGKNDVITERFTESFVQFSPSEMNPGPGEGIVLQVTERQIRVADNKTKQIADSLRLLQEKLDALEKKYEAQRRQQVENSTRAAELEAIDQVIDKIPGQYRDSLKGLIDSLDHLKSKLPAKVDNDALQKAADDAAQRAKDCQDRLDKLKAEKDKAQQELDKLNKQIEDLLSKMDQLHLGNNWSGGHGYHSDGGFWYGYVGDERSNTNITPESNAIANQLRGLRGPQNNANNKVKGLNAAIGDAEAECDKLKKEQEKAAAAAKNGNNYAAAETQVDELCRQIASLMDALKKWCAAHPGVCNFDGEMAANPRSPAELQAYLDKLDDIIRKKQQKEKDLEDEAAANDSDAAKTAGEIEAGNDKKEQLERGKAKAQADADKLRAEREKQLEEERAARQKKIDEDNARRSTPRPEKVLEKPVEASTQQIKLASVSLFHWLYKLGLTKYTKKCDCRMKAIVLANNTNTAATEVLFNMAMGVVFAPIEALPGLSFAAKLGIGAIKAIGSSMYGGQEFTDELAKNLFNVIGGEIFPKLLGSEVAGNSANTFAGKGLDAILEEEGIRATSWEGETEIRGCGKVKGKTTMLFNPNTGWVTMMIKIDGCPLVVVKYKVGDGGVPLSNPEPTVEIVKG